MTDIAITGNYDRNGKTNKEFIIHKNIKSGYKLYCGTQCNDGRPITESWRYKKAIALGCQIVKKQPILASQVTSKQEAQGAKGLFVDTYSPKTIDDIIGHKEQIKQILTWLQTYDTAEKRGLLITGPPGIGKTTTVHLIAHAAGYKVTEYNASDTRSVSVLKGMIALGIKRLIKEVIVMDEIDGLSERGGVGELADIIRKTRIPIICIANDKPPKLRPIINACVDVKFNRSNKNTIATAILKIAKTEGVNISKADLEELCERNGNDIRSILNCLQFFRDDANGTGCGSGTHHNKDTSLRLDLFSATQRLMSNKTLGFDEAAHLVFVDYNMVPLMVQEAYLAASSTLEEAERAAEFISVGDIIDRRIRQKQDWALLPHFVNNTVVVAKTVRGPAPFQIFPQWLGKNSKRLKHWRYMGNLAGKMRCSNGEMRLDFSDALNRILLTPISIASGTTTAFNIKDTIRLIDSMGLTRDDIMDELQEVLFETVDIPTKIKTAFTREYNKSSTAYCYNRINVHSSRKIEVDDGGDNGDGDGDNGVEDEIHDAFEEINLE